MSHRTSSAVARPARYLFDEVFAVDVGRSVEPAEPKHDAAALTAAIEAARKEGHERGRAEGMAAAADSRTVQLTDALRSLVQGSAALARDLSETRRGLEADAAALAVAIARKLAPALIAREPLAEIEAVLRNCLGELHDTPHVVVRVAESLVEPLREESERLSRETGFTGVLVILGDPDITPGDGRVDWADGGIVRDSAALDATIDAAVADFIAARAAAQAPQENEDG